MPGLRLIDHDPFPHSPPGGSDADAGHGYNSLFMKKAVPGPGSVPGSDYSNRHLSVVREQHRATFCSRAARTTDKCLIVRHSTGPRRPHAKAMVSRIFPLLLLFLGQLSIGYAAAEMRNYGNGVTGKLAGPEKMVGLYFEQNWSGCSDSVREKVKIKRVRLEGRYVITAFATYAKKRGVENYDIDLSSLPNSDQWLPSSLIKEGASVYITSRGCGSGLFPTLQAVEAAQ